MSKEIVTENSPFTIDHLDLKYGGEQTNVMTVDGETGDITIKNLTVSGSLAATIDLSEVEVEVVSLETTEDVTVGGDLSVTGSSDLDDVDVGGDLGVSGAADLGGDVDVSGAFVANDTALIAGTLTVSGETTLNNHVNLATGKNLVASASGAGSQIGTSAAQKLSLWGVAPVIQPATTGQTAGFVVVGTSDVVAPESTFTGGAGTKAYTIGDIVKALKAAGIMAAS